MTLASIAYLQLDRVIADNVFLNDPLSPARHVACFLLNVQALTKRLNCAEIYFNWTVLSELLIQLVIASARSLCCTKCHRYEPHSTQHFLSVPFILYSESLLYYSVYYFSAQVKSLRRQEEGRIRVELLAILNTYVSTACFSSPFDML